MKKILVTIAFILSATAHINATKHNQEQTGNKTIVVDLEGVLVEPNTTAALKEIGFGGVTAMGGSLGLRGLCRAVSGQASTTEQMVETFFKSLKSIECLNIKGQQETTLNQAEIYFKGFPAPPVIKQWLLFQDTECEQLKTHVLQGIEQSNASDSDKKVATTFAHMTFDPTKNAETLQLIQPIVKLLEKLKVHNNTIYVVANWNHEALTALQTKHPKLFEHIDRDKIIISSKAQKAKPSLYEGLSEHNVSLTDAFFIESEQRCMDQTTRPNSILYSGNTKEVQKQLKQFGALPTKGRKK